ncbi:sulfite exporter TauE/SafE family protein [Anoxybacillus rupiensis]|uniref:Probable membrane transporter protein n=2 Tax=Bacillales TaxID=1385 RepID=A0ABT5W8L8_9BACL|nr:sulfite exporter TauE/SafE family protein [Anoxybacillus rupiensis]
MKFPYTIKLYMMIVENTKPRRGRLHMDYALFIVIGALTSFVGTLAGGGGLIGMPVLLLTGVPVHQAIAAAKFSNMISSFSSFFVLLGEGKIGWKQTAFIVPISLGGGITGGLLASSLPEKTMTAIAIALLTFALSLQFFRKKMTQQRSAVFSKKLYAPLYGISVYDGMFGPGQATLLMYTYLSTGLDYLSAIAFTRFQTFISCFGAFATYLYAGHVNWHIAPFLGLGSVIGAQVSVRLAQKLKQEHLSLILNIVTFLLIIQLVFKMIG